MKHNKNRNEVNLDDTSLEILSTLAANRRWKLKFYMEYILTSHAQRYQTVVPSSSQRKTEKSQASK